MLACPRCREELRPVVMLDGFLWACPACGGRAGTLALLKHRTPKAALSALREAARTADRVFAIERAAGAPGAPAGGGGYLGYGPDGESGWIGEDARRCPSCARPLPRVAVPAQGIADALDVCPRCDLVWFERTTMSALPLKPTLPALPRPYPRRSSLAPSGHHLAWLDDPRSVARAATAVVVRARGGPASTTPATTERPSATGPRRSCAKRVLLLVATGLALGATLATVAPHALRDVWPVVVAATEGRWADVVGGALPFLAAVLVTAAFWTSARRRHRRRLEGSSRD